MNLFDSLKNSIRNTIIKFLFAVIAICLISQITLDFRGISFYGGILSTLLLTIIYISFYKQNYYLKSIVKNSLEVSKGNLDIDDIIINNDNEFKIIAESINDMKANLLFYIESTKKNIVMLSENTVTLTSGIDNTSAGNEEITASISEIAEKSEQQLELVNETTNNVDDIFANILNIKNNMNEVIELSKETNSKSENGKKIIENFEDSLNKINNSINHTNNFFETMIENISDISKVTDFIMTISNRLTILSFNAAIEAVKNGESGKGFSVVANEMKKLATLSKTELEKIKIIIDNLGTDSENIKNKMSENTQNISEGFISFNVSKEIFNDIGIYNKNMLDKVTHIIELSSGIYLLADKTNKMSELVRNGSSQISYATKEITEVITENTNQLFSLSSIAQNLNEFINNIEKLTSIFNSGIKPINKNSSKKLKIKVLISHMGKNEFWQTISQGALYAKKELERKNVDVNIVSIPISFKDFDKVKRTYIDEINKAIDEKVDGICMPGLLEEMSPLIDKAKAKGIEVILYNSDIEKNNSKLMVYKQNAYESGQVAADIISKKLNGKNKNILIIKDNGHISDMDVRTNGFVERIRKYKHLKISNIFESSTKISDTLNNFREYIKSNEKYIDGILCNSIYKLDLIKILEELNIKNKEVLVFDIGQEISEYMKKNVITCAIGQDPFGQGYSPIIYMFNYLMTNEKPQAKIWSRLSIVDTNNVNRVLS
ncbi:MAG: substrate-binding domain-containing protein [Fusobacteriaceae bacterium]|nr:substrate-binding domain-containing protein [Fusobacteriaceae bacterium]